jgi:hypothetical protein
LGSTELKIREPILGSACVPKGRIIFEEIQKNHPNPPVVIYERDLEEKNIEINDT